MNLIIECENPQESQERKQQKMEAIIGNNSLSMFEAQEAKFPRPTFSSKRKAMW